MLNLIRKLLQIADSHPELKERHGLEVAERFLKEQTYYDYGDDTYSARENKDIAANSLQSAYDQDATYRKKGSKQAVGYIENTPRPAVKIIPSSSSPTIAWSRTSPAMWPP
jgi:hypothetical protein